MRPSFHFTSYSYETSVLQSWLAFRSGSTACPVTYALSREPRPRVLVREEIAEAGVELLRARFDVDVDGESDLASIIGRYDAIVIRSATKLTADLIAAARRTSR